MMNALIRWSLHNRSLVLVSALLLLAAGSYLALRMPVDVFPDLTTPTVTVITEAHGMVPTEVESQVTFPVEAALNGAPGVRRVRSSTAVGISVVWVEFDWSTDIYAARQVVSEKLPLVAASLPPEVERPILAPISSIMGEILFIALTSDRHDPIELRTTAETIIRRRLLSVPGVSQVTPIGGEVKQYQAVLSPSKLHAFGVSLNQVQEALAASNLNVSAGLMVEGGSEFLTTGIGRVRGLEDIGETVVTAPEGVAVRVADLGTVRLGSAPKRGEGSANAHPAVILGIQKQPRANTLTLTRTLDSVLDDLQEALPKGMKIDKRIFRQADFIEVAVRNVARAVIDGGLLVIAVVLLFLANLRATIITVTAIPLSMVAAVIALNALGATINTMTLGGMAIAIGALVDDAIIDVENVFRRLRENARMPTGNRRSALDVVYDASVEIRSSIVFATLIILLAFLPLFFLPGVEGRMLGPLGLAYVVALFASLVVAMTVTPVLCWFLLPRSRAVSTGREPRVVRVLKSGYAAILGPVLRHPWAVTAPAVVLFLASVAVLGLLGRSFLPEFNEGALTISAVTLPGSSLEESDALGRLIEETLLSHPEVVSVARRTGRAELDEHAQGVEASELDVSFAIRDRPRVQFLEALRRDFSLVPGMNVTIGQPISHRIDHLLSGARANLAVKIFGDDLYRLRLLAERVRRAMALVPGVVDLSIEQQVDVPVLKVAFDRGALARHALKIQEVARTLEAALQGVTVSRVLEGRNSFDLVVRVAEGSAWSPHTIGDLSVDTPAGPKVPLRTLAGIVRETGPNTVSRENVERKIVVTCNVAGRDVASVVGDARVLIEPIVAGEPGYRVEYGGQFEAAAEAGRLLAILGVAVVIAAGFLLHLAFRSARDALLIMVNLPLALIGGVAGAFLYGRVLSVASLIGFITVFGIATRNGIMLVSHVRHLQEREGVTDFRDAVFRGALERLAPILMTALAAGLALIPLAFGGDKPGNEIQTPMAVVILFGLLTSTFLNVIVVPALYLKLGRPVTGASEGTR
jgi:CzcA family heavy metal efflux pump